MSKNYFGNYIYEYDLNRDKDFFKNISYSADLNTSLENTKYGPRFGNNCIQFDDKLFTFGGTSIETKDNGQIIYKVNKGKVIQCVAFGKEAAALGISPGLHVKKPSHCTDTKNVFGLQSQADTDKHETWWPIYQQMARV